MQGFDVGGSHKSQQSGYESFGVQNQARVDLRRRRSHGRRRRHRVLRGLLRQRRSVGQRARQRRRDELARRRDRDDDQERRQHVQGSRARHATSRAASSAATPRRTTFRRAGMRCPPNGDGRPAVRQPEPAVLGRPRRSRRADHERDKVWFYGAYNHFKIDKQVSGVVAERRDRPRRSSTTTRPKATAKISTEQHAHRLHPARAQAEAVPQPVDARAGRVDPCAGQLVEDVQGRVAVGAERPRVPQRQRRHDSRSTGRWCRAVDPRGAAREHSAIYRDRQSQTGAGWNAFTTFRSKPQVKAQMTYYLPGKAGSHDFKFGFEDIYDSYQLRHQRQSGPYRLLVCRGQRRRAGSHPLHRHRHAGRLQRTAGRPAPTSISTTAATRRIAGRSNNRADADRRLAVSTIRTSEYNDGTRKPEISDSTTGVAGRRRRPDLPGARRRWLAHRCCQAATTLAASACGISYGAHPRRHRTVLKAFYGRYYNNLARRLLRRRTLAGTSATSSTTSTT